MLKNQISEHPAPMQLMEVYINELKTSIDNSLLVPYNEEEFGLHKGLIALMPVLQENK